MGPPRVSVPLTSPIRLTPLIWLWAKERLVIQPLKHSREVWHLPHEQTERLQVKLKAEAEAEAGADADAVAVAVVVAVAVTVAVTLAELLS